MIADGGGGRSASRMSIRGSSPDAKPLYYFVHNRMRITTALGDGDCHFSQLVFPDALVQRGPEEPVTQQFNYSMLSDAHASAVRLTLTR